MDTWMEKGKGVNTRYYTGEEALLYTIFFCNLSRVNEETQNANPLYH